MDKILQWISEHQLAQRLLIITVIFLFILVLLGFIKKAIFKRITDTDSKYRFGKVLNIVSYILVVATILFVFSDKLGNIGVTLGLAGAGITFALQEVIVSIAGWFSIIISGQIKVGQRVKIGDITGDIIDIGVMKTTLMEIGGWVDGDLYNGRITSLSNNFVFKTAVQNYSGDYPFLWDEITIPLRTESDFHLARKILIDITNEVCGDFAKTSAATWDTMKGKYLIEEASVKPMVSLKFDENWITFTVRYIVDYRKRRMTKDALYTRCLEEIRKHPDTVMIATAAMEISNLHKKNG